MFEQKRKQAESDALAMGYKQGTKAWVEKVNELANPASVKVFGGGKGAGEGGEGSIANWAQGLATGNAKWSDIPGKLKTKVNDYHFESPAITKCLLK